MRFKRRWPVIIIVLILILIIAVGTAAAFAQTSRDIDYIVGDGDRGFSGDRSELWRHPRRNPDAVPQGPLGRLRHSNIDRGQLLADALGISVEELDEARVEARYAGIQQAADEGIITQDEADILLAVTAFKDTVNKADLIADALGITVDELIQAREDGLRIPELLEELELSPGDVREGLREAYEESVDEAFLSGEITQEQADLLLNIERPARLFPKFHPYGPRYPRRSGDF